MLGGASLDAMEMQAQIERMFEAPVDIDFLFEDPTLAELAARMSTGAA
jgi:hypothetical protein